MLDAIWAPYGWCDTEQGLAASTWGPGANLGLFVRTTAAFSSL